MVARRSNLELVRLAYTPEDEAGYQPSEWSVEGAERFIEELCDPDVEWVPRLPMSTEGRAFRGRDGVRRWARDMGDAWNHVRPELEELHEVGDQVLAIVRTAWRGRVSGMDLATRVAHLWTLRDGRVTRMVAFPDAQSARAAADRPG